MIHNLSSKTKLRIKMIAARKKDHGSRIPLSVKKEIALESIKREHTIVDIARRYDCSRNTVYEQQEIGDGSNPVNTFIYFRRDF